METLQHHPDDGFRLAVILNKRIETGKVMNALAHAIAGAVDLAGESGRQALKFINFIDLDAQLYPDISARSFIILRGSDGDLRKVRQRALEAGLPVVCFVDTMTGGTYLEQLQRTKATPTSALSFYAVALLGKAETLNPITRKYSLWRSDPPLLSPAPAGLQAPDASAFVIEEKT